MGPEADVPQMVKAAFESALVTLPVEVILPLHQVTAAQRQSVTLP